MFQLGLSLFLIIYTASIPRRLPRYVRRGAFGPNKGFLRKPSGPNYKSSRSHVSAFCDQNLQCAYQCRLKDGVSKQFSPFHQSPPLFLYSLSPLLSFFLYLSLSLSLSFFHSQSVPHNNANGSVIALTYGRGRGLRRGGFLRYERRRHSGFNTNYSSYWIHSKALRFCGASEMFHLSKFKGIF